MTWKPGESGNPAGLTVRQARTRAIVEGLGIKSAERLGRLIESENESVALAAIKEVLGRVAPAPKQASLQVSVQHGPDAHLQALIAMASATQARLEAQPIDITPVRLDAEHPRGDE